MAVAMLNTLPILANFILTQILGTIMWSILQIKWLVQGHTARMQESWNSHQDSLAPESMLSTSILIWPSHLTDHLTVQWTKWAFSFWCHLRRNRLKKKRSFPFLKSFPLPMFLNLVNRLSIFSGVKCLLFHLSSYLPPHRISGNSNISEFSVALDSSCEEQQTHFIYVSLAWHYSFGSKTHNGSLMSNQAESS